MKTFLSNFDTLGSDITLLDQNESGVSISPHLEKLISLMFSLLSLDFDSVIFDILLLRHYINLVLLKDITVFD